MIHATDRVQTKIISPSDFTTQFPITVYTILIGSEQGTVHPVLHYSKYVAPDHCEVGGLHSLSLQTPGLINMCVISVCVCVSCSIK